MTTNGNRTTNRNRTGYRYLTSDIRYKVVNEEGVCIYHGLDKKTAEMHRVRHPGWKIVEIKYNASPVKGYTEKVILIPKDMHVWIRNRAYEESVSEAEIIRRCIQAQMDRN